MSELNFKGKEFVFNHHLAVPHRPLVPDASRSVGEPRLDGNLIIHGDNLHALKALLPLYAGRVDCVFIDPPYNTGNEGWSYNDNVNSPMLQEWLRSNPIGVDDGLRHDKWCAMMWPRLRLLHELLNDAGSLWVTIDDNEVHRARAMLDAIFGEANFVATCIWHKADSPKNTAEHFSEDHDYVLVYAKDKAQWQLNLLPRTEEMLARYKNPDNDPRGPWMVSDLDARNFYSKGVYPIKTPKGRRIEGPPKGRYWSVSEDRFWDLNADGRIWWGPDGNSDPNIKRFLSEVKEGVVPQTLWSWKQVGSTRHSKTELVQLFSDASREDFFVTPKPTALLERVLQLGTSKDSLILDSFAGSGTTAHAVLRANAKDGGTRRFILVEGEDYADTLTAERVRRAIHGYAWNGTQRETLLEEKITLTQLKKADQLLAQVKAIKVREGLAQGDLADRGQEKTPRFDSIETKVDDGVLRVEGVRKITEHAPGLGGTFTYCALGERIDLDRLLTGASLPTFEQLGALLFHTATNEVINPAVTFVENGHGYLGESAAFHVWLIYKPDLNFLKSRESALTMAKAQAVAQCKPGKRHLVFAPAKFVSQKLLDEAGVLVEFAPLPWALYRAERV